MGCTIGGTPRSCAETALQLLRTGGPGGGQSDTVSSHHVRLTLETTVDAEFLTHPVNFSSFLIKCARVYMWRATVNF